MATALARAASKTILRGDLHDFDGCVSMSELEYSTRYVFVSWAGGVLKFAGSAELEVTQNMEEYRQSTKSSTLSPEPKMMQLCLTFDGGGPGQALKLFYFWKHVHEQIHTEAIRAPTLSSAGIPSTGF